MTNFFIGLIRFAAPIAILCVGIGGFLALGRGGELAVSPPEPDASVLVKTVTVQAHEQSLDIEVEGVATPYRNIDVTAEVPGRIVNKTVACRAGNYVLAGAPLFTIDPREYDLEVKRLEKELEQAEAGIKEVDAEISNNTALVVFSKEDLVLQQKEIARMTDLAKRNIVSTADMDEAKRREVAARNALQTLHNQANLHHARRRRLEKSRDLVAVQLERAELDRERTEIASPISGAIVTDAVEEDGYVQKGTVLVRLVDTSKIEVRCSLRVEELFWVLSQTAAIEGGNSANPGRSYEIPETPVTVVYEFGQRKYTWKGRLARYEGIGVDPSTRTIPCRVVVDEPQQVDLITTSSSGNDTPTAHVVKPPALVSGMYVKIRIHTQPKIKLVRVPIQVLRPGNTYWKSVDGKLEIMRAVVAQADHDIAVLAAGDSKLQPGDKVIISPLADVYNGLPIRESSDNNESGNSSL